MTSHALDPPPLCHILSHLLGPPPQSNVTYFMDGPYGCWSMGIIAKCDLAHHLVCQMLVYSTGARVLSVVLTGALLWAPCAPDKKWLSEDQQCSTILAMLSCT